MKKKKSSGITKYLFFTIIMIFTFIYFAVNLGYFEYSNYKKNVLTEEQIKKFEEDVKNGVEIDISTYLNETDEFYDRPKSLGLKISENISKTTRKSIIEIFKMLNKFVEN